MTAPPPRAARRLGRGERGETLPLLIIWPTLLVAIMLLALHAFILSNAQAEAAVAASKGLRAAWRAAAESDLGALEFTPTEFEDDVPASSVSAEVVRMSEAAKAAVASSASSDPQSWRWWHNQVTEVQSDWCDTRPPHQADGTEWPDGVGHRPGGGEAGWVRVTVSGEVLGPLAALWPDRLDTVHAVAEGPARFVSNPDDSWEQRRKAFSSVLPTCP